MKIGRRDFIKYGVVGMSAAAFLRPGTAMPMSGPTRDKDPGYGTFMKPSGKEAYIADRSLTWWIDNFHLPPSRPCSGGSRREAHDNEKTRRV